MTDTDTQSSTKQCSACFKDIDSRATRCNFCSQRQGDIVSLYRNVPGRAVAGVCAAIAHHFNWSIALVRVLFVASLAVTGGLVFWVYAAAWLLTPYEQNGKSPISKVLDAMRDLFSPPSTGVERVTPEQPQ